MCRFTKEEYGAAVHNSGRTVSLRRKTSTVSAQAEVLTCKVWVIARMTEVTCSLNQMSCVMCLYACVCVVWPSVYGKKKERECERERETKTESEEVGEKSLSLLKCQEKTLFILHFIWRYKVVSSTQHFSVFLPGKSPVLFLWGEMMPVRWEGKQTFWFELYCSTAVRSMFLPHVLLFAVSQCSLRELKNIKLLNFNLETSASTSFSLCSLFQLSCAASSICRHPSYFKHSGVLRWKHVRNLDDWPSTPPPSTPTSPALCYLLRGRRGQRRPGGSDEVITAYRWQWGGRPADLRGDASWAKSRGTAPCEVAHVRRSGRGAAVRAGLRGGGDVQSAHTTRMREQFANTFLVLAATDPSNWTPRPPSHFLSGSSYLATWLQRSCIIWFKLDPEACVYFLLLSLICPHHTQLHAFVSYFAQDVTQPRLLF